MESDMKDPSERRSFLIILAPVIKECCPLIQYTQKKVTHVVSICINLDCMRVEFFSLSARRFRGFTALCFCITHEIRR